MVRSAPREVGTHSACSEFIAMEETEEYLIFPRIPGELCWFFYTVYAENSQKTTVRRSI